MTRRNRFALVLMGAGGIIAVISVLLMGEHYPAGDYWVAVSLMIFGSLFFKKE